MEFPRQAYGSELPFPSPGDLPDPGIESVSHTADGSFTSEPLCVHVCQVTLVVSDSLRPYGL